MNSTTVKVPAKLNLTLDIVGKDKEYHNLQSLVTTINVYDVIKIEKRQDNQVNLNTSGIDCECSEKDNNAYKSAKLFVDTYKTCGVDIFLKKGIPLASGLGGSSADIAGVLKGMKKLFNINEDMSPLASKLGSDSAFMLNKGYAVMSGKGDKITPVKSDVKLYAIVIWDDVTISAKEGYAGYDSLKKKYESVTFKAVSCLTNLKTNFFAILKNDLQPYAESVMPSLVRKQKDLIKAGAECALMTGSGSAVYG
ncbi:MAG: 4-(cytidine 5'-diphospho)-2-C-methyl-D-erythritol kinase, partial [Firmicutes bacterium]|nr:4-(cytidine 5'-diphospho)-2-C-methyl-D-erythritol kinase [Candidatus Caballimonas caccae]